MLAVRRRIAEGHELVSGGAWGGEWKPNFMLGQDLGHDCRIDGLKPIAQAVASRLKAFWVRIGWNRTPKQLPGIEICPWMR